MNSQRPWSRGREHSEPSDNPFDGIVAREPSRLERFLYSDEAVQGFYTETADQLQPGRRDLVAADDRVQLHQDNTPVNPDGYPVRRQAGVNPGAPVNGRFVFEPLQFAQQGAEPAEDIAPEETGYSFSRPKG